MDLLELLRQARQFLPGMLLMDVTEHHDDKLMPLKSVERPGYGLSFHSRSPGDLNIHCGRGMVLARAISHPSVVDHSGPQTI